ncbi:MAG: pathogenicity locus [Bacteroidetes bacterium]|jgi:hypothetical protein|nr:pathogenicity locus [Bacteroidota bacterium]
MSLAEAIKNLTQIPGVGKSIATDLYNIGIYKVEDLKGKSPEKLFNKSNQYAGCIQDRCLLYVFRCAVWYAETPAEEREQEKLKWWYWKDKK